MMQYHQSYPGLLTPKKSSFLRYKPPGFAYPIDIPFPGRVLPVCARCKKNYKTREHCRSKEGHTSLPWTDTYICITLDNSCFLPNGGLSDGPFVATGLTAQPYVYESSKVLDPKTPSCAMCKDKNYTRTYCRASKKHKTLPWSTVYVMLTARDGPPTAGGGSTSQAQESSKKRRKVEDGSAEKVGKDDTYLGLVGGAGDKDKDKKDGEDKSEDKKDGEDKSEDKDKKTEGDETTEGKGDEKGEKKDEKKDDSKDESKDEEEAEKDAGDIFGKIHPSRTFLSTVSINKNDIEWVELDANQANYLSHRQKQDVASANDGAADGGFTAPNPYGMMAAGNLGSMGINMGGFPPNYGHFPGAMGNPAANAPGSGSKDDPNRPANGMDRNPMENQWMNGAAHGMNPHATPYADMMSQMMDPRMAGYGFHHPGWHGRGYPTPMDMSQMHNPYGQPPYGQYPPMGGQYPGMDMGQGMPPQAMAPGMAPQGFPPHPFPQQGMMQGNMTPGQPTAQKDGSSTPIPNNGQDANASKTGQGESQNAGDDKKNNGSGDDKKADDKSPQKDHKEVDV